jgi:hypothetical protein
MIVVAAKVVPEVVPCTMTESPTAIAPTLDATVLSKRVFASVAMVTVELSCCVSVNVVPLIAAIVPPARAGGLKAA